jgi:hypothetical protein
VLNRFRLWRLRGRLVRLHLEGSDPSLMGIYRGRRGGHYILDVPQLVTGAGEPAQLQGFAAVPKGRVLWVQVL